MLGDDILPLLVLALGAAMALGSGLALLRPPATRAEGELERPPVVRSGIMIAIGAVASVWALASLLAG